MPIVQVGDEKKIYKSSAMQIDGKKSKIARDIWTGNDSWTNYIPLERKIDTNSGKFRNKTGLLMLLLTPYVNFYFDGDVNKVAGILDELDSIGSRRAAGYGQVKDMEIKKMDKDYTLLDEDGYPARNIPISEIEKPDPRWQKYYTGYSPKSYYYYPLFDMCYIPPMWRWWVKLSPQTIFKKIEQELKEKEERAGK